MSIKDIIGKNIAVHCDTEEKSKIFLQECENIGIKWASEQMPTTLNYWNEHKNDGICYAISKLYNGCRIWRNSVFYMNKNEYKIIEFDEIVFED